MIYLPSTAAEPFRTRATYGVLLLLVGFGCASCSSNRSYSERDTAGLVASERAVDARRPQPRGGRSDPTGTPPLLINQQPISWEELSPVLAEAAGAGAIEEFTMLVALRTELAARNLNLAAGAVQAEEALLVRSVDDSGTLSTNEAFGVMEDLRAARGLGPVRFRMLLERNAMLRTLVRDQVTINEATLMTAHAVRHGPRRTARLIITPTQRQTSQVRQSLAATPASDLKAAFIQAALEFSTDSTAARGGLTEPISPEDPAYSPAVRRALVELVPGAISPVIAVDGGFALLLLEADVPPDGVEFEQAREALERLVRTRQERLLMDRLARQLLSQSRVTPFDVSLNWSWENRQGG